LSRWHRNKTKEQGHIIAPHSNQPLAEQSLAEQIKQLERENAQLRREMERKAVSPIIVIIK
jgi:hypothetical protein